MAGKLSIVGVGFDIVNHLTLSAEREIENADKVLYLSSNDLSTKWINKLNKKSESLDECYSIGESRYFAYEKMIEIIIIGLIVISILIVGIGLWRKKRKNAASNVYAQ